MQLRRGAREGILSLRWHKYTTSMLSLRAVTVLFAGKSQALGLTLSMQPKITVRHHTQGLVPAPESCLTYRLRCSVIGKQPLLFQLLFPFNFSSPSCCCFPCSGCLSEEMCQWVTTRSKIWLTCFMWHFNFLSVNQRSRCIFLIAPPDWQLMIDLVLG